jgi:DNA-binding transcriptional LysR family regulator
MPFKRSHLRYFVTVADEGQVTRAAGKLHIAQPALSQAIAAFEAELGFKLFERGPRGVDLTPAGAAFYEKAKAVLVATDEASVAAKSLQRGRAGVVKFGFVGTPPQIHAPELFAASGGSDQAKLSFHELPLPVGSNAEWLAGVDVAMCHCPPDDEDIWTQVLRREARCLIVPRSHRLARRKQVAVADVLDETFIGVDHAVAPWWRGFWSLDSQRGGPPQRETSDRASVAQDLFAAIASGSAVTSLPMFQANVIETLVPNVAVIGLTDAEPAMIALVGRLDRMNPAVAELAEAAKGLYEAAPAA